MTGEHFDARRNGVVGILENDDVNLHFSEWWNGEGVDFTFSKGKNGSLTAHMTDRTISMDMNMISFLVTACVYMGMVDMDEVNENVEKLEASIERRKRLMGKIRKEYHYD